MRPDPLTIEVNRKITDDQWDRLWHAVLDSIEPGAGSHCVARRERLSWDAEPMRQEIFHHRLNVLIVRRFH